MPRKKKIPEIDSLDIVNDLYFRCYGRVIEEQVITNEQEVITNEGEESNRKTKVVSRGRKKICSVSHAE